MTKQVRWKCAICNHGLLAPSKPRKNDVRRYCLPCSEETGKLVERVAPALEKKRSVTKEKQITKAKAQRQKRAVATKTKKQIDKDTSVRQAIFEKEADKIWKLLQPFHQNRISRPKIRIITTRQPRGASGVYYWGMNEATVRITKHNETENFVRDWKVLAHELCHAVQTRQVREKEGNHGRTFYKMLRHVAETRWKVTTDGWHTLNASSDSSKSWGYQCDWIIQKSLEKQNVVTFRYPRPTTPVRR
jgi:predicted SprT family Zn-dependent metalloprotease